ncbi:MAG: hypothetical protein KBE41_08880 [Lutibacter sp.]|nr:hypothetical protein [Lutibacter sp.]MBP9601603.1 hypothetical protein [Lutibacter sp.]
MNTLKTVLILFLFGGIFETSAQENAQRTLLLPKPTLSLGFGSIMPSSTAKDAFVTNTSGVSLDYSLPLTKRGWGPTGNYLALNIGGLYNFGGTSDPSVALPMAFPIAGQTSSAVAYKGADTRNSGFRFGAGPQVNFNLLEKFTLSPMVLAEYFSMTQSELSAVQTTEYNGQTFQKELWTLPETKTSGLAITPKIRMQYKLTKNLGLFADASYILGPKMQTQVSTLVPIGKANQEGFYDVDFVQNGRYAQGEPKTTSYSALGFNVGFSFAFGGDDGWNGTTESTNADINRSRSNIKQQVVINDENGNTTESIFSSIRIKEMDSENNKCVKILSPSNGSNQNVNENIKILLSNEGSKNTNVDVKIYKISNDINFFNKDENLKSLYDINNAALKSLNFEKEARETGFKPISVEAKQKGSTIETTLDKGKLTEGVYKMVAISDCGVTTSSFMVSSGALTTVSLTANCKEKFGEYSYTFVVKNTGSSPINVTSIAPFNSSTGTISSFSIAPTLPIVIPAGGTQNFTGSFAYSGTYSGDVYATVSGHQVGNLNLTSQDTEMGELKSCICDFCDKVADFDSNQSPNASYSATTSSLSIHQDWWDMNPATSGTIVAAKAEIISFDRQVSDDCMKCDKDAKQWGNFISGNSGTSNGSFGNATGSVSGNTHHTLYFANPNAFSFDLNISLPPLATLKCCCDKIKIKVRYTYTFKDQNGVCRMCSAVFQYTYQKGICPIVIDHGTGVIIDKGDVLIKGSNLKK